MSKFNIGDNVRILNTNGMISYQRPKVGKVYSVVRIEEDCFKVSGFDIPGTWLNESSAEFVSSPDSEITLNGVTYVRKEEPKPEHEWKFGDVAVHKDYGLGMVFSELDSDGTVRFAHDGNWHWVFSDELTFLRHADLSI